MSYILEALRKAQAERQLGSTPTIHASQLHLADAAGARPSRLPVAAALVVAVLAVGAAVAFYLQPVAAPTAPAAAAPAAPAVTQAATAARGPSAAAAPLDVTPQRVAAAPPVSVARVPQAAAPVPAVATNARVPAVPAVAPAAALKTAVVAPGAATADPLPLQRELPGGGAGIPKVELGGYIYSDNPADRLIVIDRELRKEGDEVAPGLVLERLAPGAAVMNYRGTRFRIPY